MQTIIILAAPPLNVEIAGNSPSSLMHNFLNETLTLK